MKRREIPQAVSLALKELKEALAKLYGERLEGIHLYGPYARGDFTEDPDADVSFILSNEVKPGAEITRLSPLVSDICLRYDVLIAPYPVPAAWLRERQSPLFTSGQLFVETEPSSQRGQTVAFPLTLKRRRSNRLPQSKSPCKGRVCRDTSPCKERLFTPLAENQPCGSVK